MKTEKANTIEAVEHQTRSLRKILVGGFNIECLRFGKVVHIRTIRRIPKIHADGRVTIITSYSAAAEISAKKHTLDCGRFFYTFDIN